MTERLATFRRAFDYLAANHIDGPIVELGVHRGGSLIDLCRLAGGRRVIAADSFDGLPAPSAHDSAQFAAGQFRTCPEQVAGALSAAGIGPHVYELHAGWFADMAPLGPCALLNLDCDLYESARDGLALVDPVDGAIVLVDDFHCHRSRPDMGVRRAWSEWLAATGRTATDFDSYAWHGRAFVVHQCA